MRQLILIVVLAALGYFGWDYYQTHKDSFPSSIPFIGKSDDAGTPPAPDQPASPGRPAVAVPPPTPQFVSRIKMPDATAGGKSTAPPGSYYMIDRKSVETPSGVVAIVPGDLVKVVRRDKGKMRVIMGQAEFDVNEDQVTQDPEIAMVAEKREFDKRYQHR